MVATSAATATATLSASRRVTLPCLAQKCAWLVFSRTVRHALARVPEVQLVWQFSAAGVHI